MMRLMSIRSALMLTYWIRIELRPSQIVTKTIDVRPDATLQKKIISVRLCIEMLDDDAFDNMNEIKKLRRILLKLTREEVKDRMSHLQQTDIRSWFDLE